METNNVVNHTPTQLQVVIRGIPKEGWKPQNPQQKNDTDRSVVIRGIPKEGWKLFSSTPLTRSFDETW
jgi:hypothetical protein